MLTSFDAPQFWYQLRCLIAVVIWFISHFLSSFPPSFPYPILLFWFNLIWYDCSWMAVFTLSRCLQLLTVVSQLSIHPFIHSLIYPSTFLCICLSIYPPSYLSMCISINLSVMRHPYIMRWFVWCELFWMRLHTIQCHEVWCIVVWYGVVWCHKLSYRLMSSSAVQINAVQCYVVVSG